MENMFSHHFEKRMPKSLHECYKSDATVDNLRLWCNRLENLGIILLWGIIVVGVIISIKASFVEKKVVVEEATFFQEAKTELKKVFDAKIFFSLVFETGLYAIIEYCSYHVLALLISSLASIVHNSKITANLALYRFGKDYPDELKSANVSNNHASMKNLNNGNSIFKDTPDLPEEELKEIEAEDTKEKIRDILLLVFALVVFGGCIIFAITNK